MGSPARVTISYASAAEIEVSYPRWCALAGIGDTPLGGYGQELAQAQRRGLLASAIAPSGVRAISAAAGKGGLAGAVAARSLVLVAQRDREVIGGLYAGPEALVLHRLEPWGTAAQTRALVGLMKVGVLAVEPEFRGEGVGASLLRYAADRAAAGRVRLMYGSCTADTDVDRLCNDRGFRVLGPGESIDLSPVLGVPAQLDPANGERLVATTIGDGPPVGVSRGGSDSPPAPAGDAHHTAS
ncbi:GNAT family N-acetyltransferase [Nocardia bhagyanarayanae]|uniref:Acetyltransferase (GNAT) family protein n=1 Tax=Nocardia bhagyanarayanae TaxID=1215925 RepID=A0A543EV52_9NOCA|nr:GNAT family N-acetyltransferase [Nocardia bhagyanarayanae]TQM25432.1 acetyltransferase (GNAT) family protein [Nocardia bhagyanarayanae]